MGQIYIQIVSFGLVTMYFHMNKSLCRMPAILTRSGRHISWQSFVKKKKNVLKNMLQHKTLLNHLSESKCFNECSMKPYKVREGDSIVISIILMRKLINRSYVTCSRSTRNHWLSQEWNPGVLTPTPIFYTPDPTVKRNILK